MVFVGSDGVGTWNVRTKKRAVIRPFEGYTRLRLGPWEGNLSRDGSRLAVLADKAGMTVAFAFDLDSNTKHPDIPLIGVEVDWVSISPLGRHVVLNGLIDGGRDRTRIFDLEGSPVGPLWAAYGRPSHYDLTVDANGEEIAVGVSKSKPDDGRVIACVDDVGARRRLAVAAQRGLGYGLGDDAMLRARRISYQPDCTRFTASMSGRTLGEFELALRGAHNLRNALAVIAVMVALDLAPQAAAPVLAGFAGVERRFQFLGVATGVTVIDDYAHHPTEVAATLETARQAFAGRRLVVAFQPHLYSRTRAFAHEFGETLAGADLLFVTEIYPAREQPIPGVSARLIVDAARRFTDEEQVRYASDLEDLVVQLRDALKDGDVFMTLGAGDITSVAHTMLDELGRSHVDA
jgi:hypothetical protein